MKQQSLTLSNEQWLLRRLMDHGVPRLDAGVTTAEERRERVRQAIIEHNLVAVIAGHRDGKPILYPQAFQALYGESLERKEVAA